MFFERSDAFFNPRRILDKHVSIMDDQNIT